MSQPSRRAILAAAVAIPTTATTLALTSGTAHAAEYSWDRKLSNGKTGNDVKQLQVRVAGWPGKGNVLAIDGVFGDRTEAAVKRFQNAYNLKSDGIAGSATFNKIYSIQSPDNTPIHFTYSELNKCNNTWGGGKVSASRARSYAKRVMWRLEAMRHALGDKPLYVSSAFRSVACNNAVNGHPNSQHMYGRAADLTGSHSLCTIAKRARYHGFNVILGPGFPNHGDHIHVDIGSYHEWTAPNCGV